MANLEVPTIEQAIAARAACSDLVIRQVTEVLSVCSVRVDKFPAGKKLLRYNPSTRRGEVSIFAGCSHPELRGTLGDDCLPFRIKHIPEENRGFSSEGESTGCGCPRGEKIALKIRKIMEG